MRGGPWPRMGGAEVTIGGAAAYLYFFYKEMFSSVLPEFT